MKASRIVSTAALIALIGGPGAGLSQTMAMEPKAAIQAESNANAARRSRQAD